jgi:arylsulfatase A-like enzyme
MDGILIGAGDGVPAGTTLSPRALLDLAPTILETMGVRSPTVFAGQSFASELFPVA